MTTTSTRQKGINLVELLVAMSIAAVSLVVGVPSFENVRMRSDRSSSIIELVGAARLARSEAALRGTAYSMCASANGTSCSDSDDWSTGWIVFADQDANGQVASQDDVVKVVQFANPRFTLTADTNIGAFITFGTFGYAQPPHGEITYTDAQARRAIHLTYIGRLHVDQTTQDESSS